MSQAEELLNSLSDEEFVPVSPSTEEHIVIDSDRFITVPSALQRIAVQFDHNVETVTFDCPRYWDGLDMSKMKVYINYMRSDNARGMYLADNVFADKSNPDIMHFDWTISNNVTLVKGKLSFLVCIKKTDSEGIERNHWNSELNTDMYISEGLECAESILANYPDIITQLLTRMDYVETIATPENMQEYIDEYFTSYKGVKELKNYIYEYLSAMAPTTPDLMRGYVDEYLDRNPPLFVIGANKPDVKCLWFNTGYQNGKTPDANSTVVAKMTSDDDYGMYAEVEETGKTTNYKFDIE